MATGSIGRGGGGGFRALGESGVESDDNLLDAGVQSRRPGRRGPLLGAALGALLLGALCVGAATRWSPRSGSEASPGGRQFLREEDIVLEDEEAGGCAVADHNCMGPSCCAKAGLQCYKKDPAWAQCLIECTPGQPNGKGNDGTPWDCAELGPRAEATGACSTKGGNCQQSQCCSMQGMQCYEKDEFWASCLETCEAAFVNNDPTDPKSWTCREIGPRTPGEVPKKVFDDDFWKPKSSKTWPAGSAADCSWPGEDCTASKCCNMDGFECYGINQYWSSCSENCTAETKDSDGKPATCELLGESRVNQEPYPPAAADEEVLGTTLYCITVVKADSYETKLVDAMQALDPKVGIFACDASAVLKGGDAKLGHWGSVSNVDVFIDIWNQVKADGAYKQFDWVVKVDPDAVFLPERLKQHLVNLRPPGKTPHGLYLKNCDYLFGFMGSLEVFTSTALDTYYQSAEKCSKYFGHSGGEGAFDVANVTDDQLPLRATLHKVHGSRSLAMFLGRQARAPVTTVGLALQDARAASHSSAFEVRGADGSHYGLLELQPDGSYNLMANAHTLLSIDGNDDSSLSLRLFSGNKVQVGKVSCGAPGGTGAGELVDIRSLPGIDPVLIVTCVLAVLLMCGEPDDSEEGSEVARESA